MWKFREKKKMQNFPHLRTTRKEPSWERGRGWGRPDPTSIGVESEGRRRGRGGEEVQPPGGRPPLRPKTDMASLGL